MMTQMRVGPYTANIRHTLGSGLFGTTVIGHRADAHVEERIHKPTNQSTKGITSFRSNEFNFKDHEITIGTPSQAGKLENESTLVGSEFSEGYKLPGPSATEGGETSDILFPKVSSLNHSLSQASVASTSAVSVIESFAIKVIKKKYLVNTYLAGLHDMIRAELMCFLRLEHPNILSLRDVYVSDKNVYAIYDHVLGESLRHRINRCGKLRESEAYYVFAQLLFVMSELHRVGLHHRGVRPENLIIENGSLTLKVRGFGIETIKITSSRFQERKDRFSSFCIDPDFMAMQQSNINEIDRLSCEIDAYACGAVLFYMLTGSPLMQPTSRDRQTSTKVSSTNSVKAESIYKESENEPSERGRKIFFGSAAVQKYPLLSEVLNRTENAIVVSKDADAFDLVEKLTRRNLNYRWTVHEARYHPWMLRMGESISTKKANNELYLFDQPSSGMENRSYSSWSSRASNVSYDDGVKLDLFRDINPAPRLIRPRSQPCVDADEEEGSPSGEQKTKSSKALWLNPGRVIFRGKLDAI